MALARITLLTRASRGDRDLFHGPARRYTRTVAQGLRTHRLGWVQDRARSSASLGARLQAV